MAIFIDFPFDSPNQRSMDLKLIIKTIGLPIERAISIKTGESFKKDLRTDDSTQIKESFEELKVYNDLHGETTDLEMFLVISPPIKSRIASYWERLKAIDGKHIYTADARIATDSLFSDLSMPEFATPKDMFGFIKNISICDSYQDVPDSEIEDETPLDDIIIRKIQKLAKELGADSTATELPDKLLMFEMLHSCQRYAGTGTDMSPILTKILLGFFAQRLMINRNGTEKFKDKHDEIKRVFEIWRRGVSIVTRDHLQTGPLLITKGGTVT